MEELKERALEQPSIKGFRQVYAAAGVKPDLSNPEIWDRYTDVEIVDESGGFSGLERTTYYWTHFEDNVVEVYRGPPNPMKPCVTFEQDTNNERTMKLTIRRLLGYVNGQYQFEDYIFEKTAHAINGFLDLSVNRNPNHDPKVDLVKYYFQKGADSIRYSVEPLSPYLPVYSPPEEWEKAQQYIDQEFERFFSRNPALKYFTPGSGF